MHYEGKQISSQAQCDVFTESPHVDERMLCSTRHDTLFANHAMHIWVHLIIRYNYEQFSRVRGTDIFNFASLSIKRWYRGLRQPSNESSRGPTQYEILFIPSNFRFIVRSVFHRRFDLHYSCCFRSPVCLPAGVSVCPVFSETVEQISIRLFGRW